jgi:serine protease Do
MSKYRTFIFFLLHFIPCLIATAQKGNTRYKALAGNQISAKISSAIAKGYPASVLMWEIDGVSHTRLSAQFSGVVVSIEGKILSAAHVVMPGKFYQVMFPDGRDCVAKGLGRISIPPAFMLPDAAMLEIVDKGSWPFAEMGWSSSLTTDQPCISIAYPESLEQRRPSVRFGHISVLKNKYGFMQSTCVMEPGDSGGPLFDLSGRVIGIHSGIETAEDINYEIPIDTYRRYYSALSKSENFTSLPVDTNIILPDPFINAAGLIKKQNRSYRKVDLDKNLKQSCVRISSIIEGKKHVILGTLLCLKKVPNKQLAVKWLLISKNSMVGDAPLIIWKNGGTTKGTVLKRDRKNDLVLIQISKDLGKGITLNDHQTDTITLADVGKQLISPRPDSSAQTGVLGSMLQSIGKKTSYGYIGAATGFKRNKLVFTIIQPESAANASGLLTDDVVEAVDGRLVADELDFVRALAKYSAGDTTMITITRGSEKFEKTVVLHYPPQRVSEHPAERFLGGKSVRRDGFNNVLVQDAAVKPNDCGGPVFDFEGKFIGINIARLSRTSTVIMPRFIIKRFIINALR